MRKIPMAEWAGDHWSLLAYLEVRCVDHRGTIEKQHLRCNIDTHPHQGHAGSKFFEEVYPYSTRLVNGTTQTGHDDWDVLDDLEHAGLLENVGTGLHPVVRLTDAGRALANQIRNWKTMPGGSFSTFKPAQAA